MDDYDEEYIDESETRKESSSKSKSKSAKSSSAGAKGSAGGGSQSIKSLKGANGGYAWEDEYHRSWDIVMEDDGDNLEGVVAGMVEASKSVESHRLRFHFKEASFETLYSFWI